MDDDTRKMFRAVGYLSTVGLSMALSIGIGVGIGYYLDRKFGSEPWLLMVFMLLGVVAAFRNLYIMYKKGKNIGNSEP